MVSKALLWSFILFGVLAALGFSVLDLELLRRISDHQGDPLVWTLFLLAVMPCTLAGWAVPLAVAYRLRYDRRNPAGLPGGPGFLMAHYRSPFWRAYASLFAYSLLFLLVYLFVSNWWVIALELITLAYVSIRAFARQSRLNRAQMVVFRSDHVEIPPYGKIPRKDLTFGVREELTVMPKRDQLCWWVTVNGQNWKRCELREHAQAIADWLTNHSTP